MLLPRSGCASAEMQVGIASELSSNPSIRTIRLHSPPRATLTTNTDYAMVGERDMTGSLRAPSIVDKPTDSLLAVAVQNKTNAALQESEK
jgi:hypothetical protein